MSKVAVPDRSYKGCAGGHVNRTFGAGNGLTTAIELGAEER